MTTKCFVSLQAFENAVGVVNATSRHIGVNTVEFRTEYRMVAERIESMARSLDANVTATVKENRAKPWLPIYVVRASGFYR